MSRYGMLLLILIFTVLGCSDKSGIPQKTIIEKLKIKEICLNGIIYYHGWGGQGNGGPMMAPKVSKAKKFIGCE